MADAERKGHDIGPGFFGVGAHLRAQRLRHVVVAGADLVAEPDFADAAAVPNGEVDGFGALPTTASFVVVGGAAAAAEMMMMMMTGRVEESSARSIASARRRR